MFMCIKVCVFMWDFFDLDSILQRGDELFKIQVPWIRELATGVFNRKRS